MPGMQVQRSHQESADCYWIFVEGLQQGLNPRKGGRNPTIYQEHRD